MLPVESAFSSGESASFEDGLVEIFSEMADLFGNPRSHGAIYGLLFASSEPLSMDEIVDRLEISKGSASQGLRLLEELGAVVREREEGSRSSRYVAKLELRPLVNGFLAQRLIPRLQSTELRLSELRELAGRLPAERAGTARVRVERLTKWHKNAATILPLARKVLLGG